MGRRFVDKVALIVGAGSGIGAATAERLAREGARVWIADRDFLAATRVAARMGGRAVGTDVTDPASVETMVESVLEDSQRLDVVVNSAGITGQGSAWDTARACWDEVLAVNLTGTFNVARSVLAVMTRLRSGSLVNIASDAGLVGMTGQAAYCAAKGGVVQFTRAAALDAAPFGVRVNAVCPCFVDTPLVQAWVASAHDQEQARKDVDQAQPIGRVGKPQEIAAAIAFLASDEAAFITGVALPVDGGVTAA